MTARALHIIVVFCGLISLSAAGQKNALKQPECLLNPGKEVRIDQVISAQYSPQKGKVVPWVVYANRGDDFGRKYYVVGENLTQFHIFSGNVVSGVTILNARDRGFRPKSEFLFHFSADFTTDALIHRKCVVLNSQGLIDSICKGLIDESRIPVYADPYVRNMQNYTDASGNIHPRFLPLYSIYFIYQSENNRYLLGRDYKFEPGRPFADQIIGWVDAYRVFDYNNRLCFEPNFEAAPVRQRRCDTIFGNAKVFSTVSELEVFLTNRQANIEPFWEEPNTLFLRQPNRFFSADTFNIHTFRNTIGKTSCAPGTKCFLANFTNSELKADFFRFPFLGINRADKKTFQVAATGKYIRSRRSNCDSLTKDKYNLKVFFIIPDSLPNFYPVFFLNQLNEKYTGFSKEYNASYYPQSADHLISLASSHNGRNNYITLRDSLISHKPAARYQGGAGCFNVLNQVLEQEPFNNRETNLIVLINTPQSNYEPAGFFNSIAGKLAEKNCYLLAFDFADNKSFIASVDTIVRKAAVSYSIKYNLPPFPVEWQQKSNCRFLTNYLLAVHSSIDTTALKGPQILDYIQTSYDPLISTVSLTIKAACTNNPDTIALTPNETRFKQGLEKIVSGCSRDISSMRILKKGFTRIRYQDNSSDIWKAEVIMTENELHDLITQLDGFLIPQTGSTLCERICTLWQTLISRFIGQQLLADNSFLDLTICQIINRMIGSSFGYYCNEPVKRFTLRDICQGQENVLEPAYQYLKEIEIKKDLLKQKYNSEYFHINEEAVNSKSIRYYWVPVSLLP
jgi:hypothetical protein